MKVSKLLALTGIFCGAMLFQGQANALGPAAGAESCYACTHSGGSLILRAGPGQKFKKLAGIPYGTTLPIIDSVDGKDGFIWYKVRYGKRIGYARSDYVCGV